MTVMPLSSDFADKAVSTEDAASGLGVAHIEAVLAALVETKVEAMKASSSASKRSGSIASSPRRPRLTSSSTASSSQNQHHHNPKLSKKKKDQRRHASAPCPEFIEEEVFAHRHHGENFTGDLWIG